jgi:SET domain-containing protein
MMTVRTYISQSSIAGIGIYAAEFIPKGTVIWMRGPLDITVSDEAMAALPLPAREQLSHHVYVDAATGERVLCGDNARFMNHSEEPNTGQVSPDIEVALRDIEAGEEITCDYRSFDLDCRAKGLDFHPNGTTSATHTVGT